MAKSNKHVIVRGKARAVHFSKTKKRYYYIRDGKRVYTTKTVVSGRKPSSKSMKKRSRKVASKSKKRSMKKKH